MTFDTDKYDLKWELAIDEAVSVLKGLWIEPQLTASQADRSALTSIPLSRWVNPFILDIRAAEDYDESHVFNALSSPMEGFSSSTPNPLAEFTETDDLRQQWTSLKAKFSGQDPSTEKTLSRKLSDSVIVVLCYSGETSRIATAVLRTRGLEAFSVRGGTRALEQVMRMEPKSHVIEHMELESKETQGYVATALRV